MRKLQFSNRFPVRKPEIHPGLSHLDLEWMNQELGRIEGLSRVTISILDVVNV